MTVPPILLVLVKGYPRLSETFVAQELLSLEEAGFRLHIVAMRRPTDKAVHPVHERIAAPVDYLPEYLHDEPLRVLRSLFAARRLPGFRNALSLFWKDLRRDVTRNRIRRFGQAAVLAVEMPEQARQIYAHFIHTPGSVARYAAAMTGLPWSCSAHAKDIWTTPDWELREKLADADFAVTCTEAGLDRLASLAPTGKVRLVHHGLDLARFRPLRVPPQNRDGADPSKPVRFLTVARAVEKKGLDVLVEALSRLPSDIAWTWTHIGGGETKTLKALASLRGIADRCRFLGSRAQAEVMAAYRDADVFALPCRIAADGDRDGLPNVLMEAGSQGLALVSTGVAGVGELIEDNATGLIVPSDDVAALARTLERLARAPEERHRLGRAASRKVFARFDHAKAIDGLIRLFPRELRSAEAGDLRQAAE
jgi:glycosyltransferase involved in cell wall biosynthesis